MTVIFQGSIDAALKLPITHKSMRQLPPATAIVNKDGIPNSADDRVLYVNIIFFKSYREIDTVLSNNTIIVTSKYG